MSSNPYASPYYKRIDWSTHWRHLREGHCIFGIVCALSWTLMQRVARQSISVSYISWTVHPGLIWWHPNGFWQVLSATKGTAWTASATSLTVQGTNPSEFVGPICNMIRIHERLVAGPASTVHMATIYYIYAQMPVSRTCFFSLYRTQCCLPEELPQGEKIRTSNFQCRKKNQYRKSGSGSLSTRSGLEKSLRIQYLPYQLVNTILSYSAFER